MVMSEGEHCLYTDSYFGITTEKEIERTGTLEVGVCVRVCNDNIQCLLKPNDA